MAEVVGQRRRFDDVGVAATQLLDDGFAGVTPARRAKNGDAAIRSRSTRNGLIARPAPDSATHDRRAARASSSTPRRLSPQHP
jgi:hypothetical protein